MNKPGWPLQTGWPGNNNHYSIALLSPDGQYDMERDNNYGDETDCWTSGMALGPGPGAQEAQSSQVSMYANTDRYSQGIIHRSGIHIYDISVSGDTMTFQVDIPGVPAAFIEEEMDAPTRSPTRPPMPNLTDSPTNSPTNRPTPSPTEPQRETASPTWSPTDSLTRSPMPNPTDSPTDSPTSGPTPSPTESRRPTASPTRSPTSSPTNGLTDFPTRSPTISPSASPLASPTTSSAPTLSPTDSPSEKPVGPYDYEVLGNIYYHECYHEQESLP